MSSEPTMPDMPAIRISPAAAAIPVTEPDADAPTAALTMAATRPLPIGEAEADVLVRRRTAREREPWLSWAIRDVAAVPWPLFAVLGVQAVLSLRLAWSNTAYIDEATYLWAGHLEWAHLLHGAAVPPFQTWLSGAPVAYPLIGALADSAAGLAAARLLSLAIMLATTGLLWGVTSSLFGKRAATAATALFAVLGPTQFLGAFATYDAMALFLLALASWFLVKAQDRPDSSWLLIAAAIILAAANATKYATTLFDPAVIALGAVVQPCGGAKQAIRRAGFLVVIVAGLDGALIAFGGPLYLAGIEYTTLSRATGDNPASQVFADAWMWVGPVCAAAIVGVALSILRRDGGRQALVLGILASCGLLAPLEQARIHTITSLHKHVDFGAWFAAIAAGYLIAAGLRVWQRWFYLIMAALATVGPALPLEIAGQAQAAELYQWPYAGQVVATLQMLTREYPGNYLAEDYDIPAYYLERSVGWQRWSDTWYFSYAHATGANAYRAAITRHYFSLIILDFGATPATDAEIAADMHRAGDYQVVGVVPFSHGQYTIWAYRAPGRNGHGYR